MEPIFAIVLFLSAFSFGDTSVNNEPRIVLDHLGLTLGSAIGNIHATSRAKRSSQTCSSTVLLRRLQRCPGQKQAMEVSTAFLTDAPVGSDPLSKLRKLLSDVCDNTECTIKCIVDTIGDCYKDDMLLNSDPLTKTISLRALCDSKHDFIGSSMRCIKGSSLERCLSNFKSDIKDMTLEYSWSQNSRVLRTSGCRAYNKYKSCVKFPAVGSCTAEDASFLTDLIVTGASFRTCGKQDNRFFAEYAGEVQCKSKGGNGHHNHHGHGLNSGAPNRSHPHDDREHHQYHHGHHHGNHHGHHTESIAIERLEHIATERPDRANEYHIEEKYSINYERLASEASRVSPFAMLSFVVVLGYLA